MDSLFSNMAEGCIKLEFSAISFYFFKFIFCQSLQVKK
jgi:hypothetical protein